VPKNITVIGGNLNQELWGDYRTEDLLKDPYYLAKNAAITADCALKVSAPLLKSAFADSPALILGWGRIGKCLARMLSALGCPVTVAARKDSDRAILEALGYRAADFPEIPSILTRYRVLFNTVPNLPLHSDLLDNWKNGIAIDLASEPGMQGKSVIPARGLPGKYAPESSGKLIADTILKVLKEE
jgi:dipicolinate synthase subunit A